MCQQEHEEELQILRDRCETLEAERDNGGSGVSSLLSSFYRLLSADPQFLRQLQSDMLGLVEEHTELSRRNDELMTAKDADLVAIHDVDAQCNDYKRKYELAMGSQKFVFTRVDKGLVLLMTWVHVATSQLFLQPPPRTGDSFPILRMVRY